MRKYCKDEGLVIKKTQLQDNHQLITIFSSNNGKIAVTGFGVKKITSRRLSHLETGNFIRFGFVAQEMGNVLQETELVYGYSKTRRSEEKLNILFLVFFVLNKILPENQPDEIIFEKTLLFLKHLNNKETTVTDEFREYLNEVLIASGFVSLEQIEKPHFDSIKFTENLIGQKIRIT
jgi:DNA repair protein RecO (recombination protein O)